MPARKVINSFQQARLTTAVCTKDQIKLRRKNKFLRANIPETMDVKLLQRHGSDLTTTLYVIKDPLIQRNARTLIRVKLII